MHPSSILEQIAAIDFLRKAWISLNKGNKSSKGVSNETIESFGSNLEQNLRIISTQLKDNKYTFSKVKAVILEKRKKTPKTLMNKLNIDL